MLPCVALRTRKRLRSRWIIAFDEGGQVAADVGSPGLDAGGLHALTRFALQDKGKE